MGITPIKTENDYRTALKRMELLFDVPINTPESDEADILGLLIDEYEEKHYPITTSAAQTTAPKNQQSFSISAASSNLRTKLPDIPPCP